MKDLTRQKQTDAHTKAHAKQHGPFLLETKREGIQVPGILGGQ
jgi:hypothetical protein